MTKPVDEARQDQIISWSVRAGGVLMIALGGLVGFTDVLMPRERLIGDLMLLVGVAELLFLAPWIVRLARRERARRR